MFKNLMKSTSIYAGGSLINRAIPFVLLPVLTRFLSPEDYGVLAIFMAVFGVMQILVAMGTIDAIVRAYFDIGKEGFDFAKYVFNGLTINLVICVGILGVLYLGKPYFVRVMPIPFFYQVLIPLLSLCVAVYTVPTKLWVFRKKPVPYTLFNAGNVMLEVLLAAVLIVFMHFDWRGRVLGIAISRFVFLGVGIYFLLRYGFCRPSFNKKYIKSILHFGFPVTLHSAGFVIIAAIDRFFLNKFIGLSVTGIYSVSYSLCALIGFLTGAFNAAWAPIFYEKLGSLSRAGKAKLVQFTYAYFFLVLAGTILFIFLVPGILNILVGEKFLGARAFVFWLALGFAFHGMYTLVVSYIFYEKKTTILGKVAFFTVLLSFVSNYVLIKVNGAVGVAQATCLVFFSRFLLVWYFGNKVYPMPWFSFAKGT